MALIDLTSQFTRNSDGKYVCEFDSCTGVLQVDREIGPDSTLMVFTNFPGLVPHMRHYTDKPSMQVDLELHEGMTVRIESGTRVLGAKLSKDE